MPSAPSASSFLSKLSTGRFKWIYKLIGIYPPYLGTGISLKEVSNDCSRFVVQMKMRFYNRNAYGYHFGGSLFSMCDPFYILIIHHYFGEGYILWDKSAGINFISPGKGKVTAEFEIKPERLAEMKKEVDAEGKKSFSFSTSIKDEKGNIVAEVEKEIYVRKKS
jgi:acyl-coenzyme A thioesterase PaaI-like protein